MTNDGGRNRTRKTLAPIGAAFARCCAPFTAGPRSRKRLTRKKPALEQWKCVTITSSQSRSKAAYRKCLKFALAGLSLHSARFGALSARGNCISVNRPAERTEINLSRDARYGPVCRSGARFRHLLRPVVVVGAIFPAVSAFQSRARSYRSRARSSSCGPIERERERERERKDASVKRRPVPGSGSSVGRAPQPVESSRFD